MRTLSVFESLSLDGYFTDAGNDMSWAYAGADDPEFAEFTAANAEGGGALVFGRVTYQMMAGWWPTPAAAQAMPVVAERMNSLPKIVFSRTLKRADWSNSTLIRKDPVAAIRRFKGEAGPDMVILGSGTIVALLARAGLIDEYQFVYVPVTLGAGRTVFGGTNAQLKMKLLEQRAFKNGKLFVRYAPAG